MVDVNVARNLLKDSLADLEKRFSSQMSPDDYAADIINVTCRYFLNKYNDISCGDNAMLYFNANYLRFKDEIGIFVGSIRNDYPIIITPQNIIGLTQNICLNIGWNEMPAFLDEYFYKKHGLSNDNLPRKYEYSSSSHIRFEGDTFIERSNVDRQISLSFSKDMKKMSVCIIPTLSLKQGILISQQIRTYIYRSIEEDYIFIVRFDNYEEVDYFSIELKSRHLKIEYSE